MAWTWENSDQTETVIIIREHISPLMFCQLRNAVNKKGIKSILSCETGWSASIPLRLSYCDASLAVELPEQFDVTHWPEGTRSSHNNRVWLNFIDWQNHFEVLLDHTLDFTWLDVRVFNCICIWVLIPQCSNRTQERCFLHGYFRYLL